MAKKRPPSRPRIESRHQLEDSIMDSDDKIKTDVDDDKMNGIDDDEIKIIDEIQIVDIKLDIIDATDEEAERKSRILEKTRSTLKNLESENCQVNQDASTSSSLTSADLYATCIRLCAAKKINAKNAFQLNPIDYLNDMVQKKGRNNYNFQEASCALDASTTVYGYRVDSLHYDTRKLAGCFDKDDVTRTQNCEEMPIAKTPRKRITRSTVEKNLRNLNFTSLEKHCDVDPLFKKALSQCDSNRGGNFLYCLPTRDDTCQMFFETHFGQFNSCENEENKEARVPVSIFSRTSMKWPKSFPFNQINNIKICPGLENFRFNGSSQDHDLFVTDWTSSSFFPASDKHLFDASNPILADDHNRIDDENSDHDEIDEPVAQGVVENSFTDTEILRCRLSFQDSEYTYFDSKILDNWQSPKHWKFRKHKFETTKKNCGSLNSDTTFKAPIKIKDQEPHDLIKLYESEYGEGDVPIKQIKRALSIPKTATQLKEKIMESWSCKNVRLSERDCPDITIYSGLQFGKLFHWDLELSNNLKKNQESDDAKIANNILASSDEETPMDQDQGDDNVDPSDSVLEPSDSTFLSTSMGKPYSVLYPQRSKKMDIKRLQNIEWDLLSEKVGTFEVLPEDEDKTYLGNMSYLYKELHSSKKMTLQMTEEMSVPLAIVGLLHVCNDRNLTLKSTDDYSDFKIYKD